MSVVNKQIDAFMAMEAKLGQAVSLEEAFALYEAKCRLEDDLDAMETELNRVTRGWVWMSPVTEVSGREPRVSHRPASVE